MPGLLFGAVAPQHSDQMLARAALARAACEIDQQRQVLAPQQLGGSRGAADRDARGAEHSEGHVGHRVPIIGYGAARSKHGYILRAACNHPPSKRSSTPSAIDTRCGPSLAWG